MSYMCVQQWRDFLHLHYKRNTYVIIRPPGKLFPIIQLGKLAMELSIQEKVKIRPVFCVATA